MLIAAMGAQAALVYVYGDKKKKQKKSIVVFSDENVHWAISSQARLI